jgi:hypothetical protein
MSSLRYPAGLAAAAAAAMPTSTGVPLSELDTDPRELERFAEHFKQRRIKLGVTQVSDNEFNGGMRGVIAGLEDSIFLTSSSPAGGRRQSTGTFENARCRITVTINNMPL